MMFKQLMIVDLEKAIDFSEKYFVSKNKIDSA